IPERSPYRYRRIFGFQRRVWCPKWTPASRSSRLVTTGTVPPPSGCPSARFGSHLGPVGSIWSGHRSRVQPPNPRRDPEGDPRACELGAAGPRRTRGAGGGQSSSGDGPGRSLPGATDPDRFGRDVVLRRDPSVREGRQEPEVDEARDQRDDPNPDRGIDAEPGALRRRQEHDRKHHVSHEEIQDAQEQVAAPREDPRSPGSSDRLLDPYAQPNGRDRHVGEEEDQAEQDRELTEEGEPSSQDREDLVPQQEARYGDHLRGQDDRDGSGPSTESVADTFVALQSLHHDGGEEREHDRVDREEGQQGDRRRELRAEDRLGVEEIEGRVDRRQRDRGEERRPGRPLEPEDHESDPPDELHGEHRGEQARRGTDRDEAPREGRPDRRGRGVESFPPGTGGRRSARTLGLDRRGRGPTLCLTAGPRSPSLLAHGSPASPSSSS